MDRSEKSNIKYIAQHFPLWSSKYHPDKDLRETYWKCQRESLTAPAIKNNRRTLSPTVDLNSYLTTCKQHKHPSCPNSERQRYPAVQKEPARHCTSPPTQSKHVRTKLCSNNTANIRKSRYQGESEDVGNLRYVEEEQGTCTEDNADDDLCDEGIMRKGRLREHLSNDLKNHNHSAEEDQEETVDSVDKDYEEQEADDEVDEESDTFVQLQGRTKKTVSRLPQKVQPQDQHQPDARRFRYQQPSRLQNVCQENLPTRYYHNDLEIPESEEEMPRPVLPKCTSKKLPMGDLRTWTQVRNSLDRYESLNSPTQPARRARTRPEIESLLETELTDTKRCSRCGSSSGKKESSTRKNSYRFRNESNIPVKGAIGDEVNIGEQTRNHYNRRDSDDKSAYCGIPRSAYYAMKPRRSRKSKVPANKTSEDQDQRQLIDEITNDYTLSISRYPREMVNVFRDTARHSVQTACGQNPTRLSSKYAA